MGAPKTLSKDLILVPELWEGLWRYCDEYSLLSSEGQKVTGTFFQILNPCFWGMTQTKGFIAQMRLLFLRERVAKWKSSNLAI